MIAREANTPLRGHWLLGSARQMVEAPHLFPARCGWQNGGFARFRIAHRRFISITCADAARQILVTHEKRYTRSYHHRNGASIFGNSVLTMDGEPWLARRRHLLPAFRLERLHQVVEATQRAANLLLDFWGAACAGGEPVPVVAHMQRLSLAVIGEALMSADVSSAQAQDFAAAVKVGMQIYRKQNTSVFNLPLSMQPRRQALIRRTRAGIDAFVRNHVSRIRRGAAAGAGDVLSMLLASEHGHDADYLPEPALVDEIKTLFVAGFETTAIALAWALQLLAANPERAERWHAEIARVLPGDNLNWKDLERLEYTMAVAKETLRLYPPSYAVPRQCVQDDTLNEHAVRKGQVLLISVYGIQRNRKYWPDPDSFRPERFLSGGPDFPHAFLPFATGKHTCIGNSFALTEMVVALAMIGQRFRLRLGVDGMAEIEARIMLAPSREVMLHLEPA